jgi:hypothetical protein
MTFLSGRVRAVFRLCRLPMGRREAAHQRQKMLSRKIHGYGPELQMPVVDPDVHGSLPCARFAAPGPEETAQTLGLRGLGPAATLCDGK